MTSTTTPPVFRCTVHLELPGDRVPYMRWLNSQHWPELGGAAPAIGVAMTDEQIDAGYAMHRSQPVTIEGVLGVDGRLTATAVLAGGKRYRLVEDLSQDSPLNMCGDCGSNNASVRLCPSCERVSSEAVWLCDSCRPGHHDGDGNLCSGGAS